MISEQSSSGEPLKISGYSSEVSDADWYRDRFDKSKTDLSRALRDAGISTWLFDMRKDRIRIDGPVIELLGLGNQKTITTPEWVDLVHPDDMPIIEEAIINLNKSGTMHIEFRLNPRIGDIVWV